MNSHTSRNISGIELSIILPLYNEEDNLKILHEKIVEILSKVKINAEIIFVDDGSTDNSRAIIEELPTDKYPTVYIELTRNFGHQYALSAGLDYCRGSACVLMDTDLQDQPETISIFLERWKEGFEVVYAVRGSRQEGIIMKFFYKLYYKILKSLVTIDLPLDAGDFCLLDRKAIDLIRALPEKNRFLRGLRSWIGLKQCAVVVDRAARFSGKPKYTLSKLLTLGLDGIIAFSFIPLRAISILGLMISTCSALLALFYFIKKLTVGLHPEGFATIVVLICFFSGIQLVTLGIIGEYIARVFSEVKNRPLYLVKNVVAKGV